MTTTILFVIFFTALFTGLVLTPLAIRLAHRFGVLDHPGSRKIHQTPMAKLGGLAIVASILAGLLSGLAAGVGRIEVAEWEKLVFIMGGTLLAALLGLADDLKDMRPRGKILWQALIVGLFVVFGYRFEFLYIPGLSPVDLGVFDIAVTMFWMLAIWNGFNFMDGLDGLAGSVTVTALLALGLISALQLDRPVEMIWLSAIASVLVFLVYNWRPAKIYMGDSGSGALGMLVASSLVALGNPSSMVGSGLSAAPGISVEPFRYKFFICTLLVAYPALEVALSAARRGVKKLFYGRSMAWSEKEHIHHRLLKAGMKPSNICFSAMMFNLLMAGAGFMVLVSKKGLAMWIIMLVVMALTYVMPRLGFFDFLSFRAINLYQPHYVIAHNFIGMQKAKIGLVKDLRELMQLVIHTCVEFGVESFRLVILPARSRPQGVDRRTPNRSATTSRGTTDVRTGSIDASAAPRSSDNQSVVHGLATQSEAQEPDRTGGCDFAWRRPEKTQMELLSFIHAEGKPHRVFRDRAALPRHKGEVGWIFEPVKEEGELEVEYRVLISEFMHESLVRAAELAPESDEFTREEIIHEPSNVVPLHDLKKRMGKS